MNTITIGNKKIGKNYPTFFIADIGANHDGELDRAKELIYLAAEAGADAAKFQHFEAETIVSDHGFTALGGRKSHQSGWGKSVFQVYEDASVNLDWTPVLKKTCSEVDIEFFTSPYSVELTDHIDPFVPAHKIGSGDITWLEIIEHIASKQKPLILSTGASSALDVERAVSRVLQINQQLALLQCNTNYTGSLGNFKYIQLRVLESYREMYPDLIVGLSDHTPGYATVLGAVTLGARIIEKHFTDDNSREGPDHVFSMDPTSWSEMVECTRQLENALGTKLKKVEDNELETVVLQRRSIRLKQNMLAGKVLSRDILEVLRPCPKDAVQPFQMQDILGRELRRDMDAGDYLRWTDIV